MSVNNVVNSGFENRGIIALDVNFLLVFLMLVGGEINETIKFVWSRGPMAGLGCYGSIWGGIDRVNVLMPSIMTSIHLYCSQLMAGLLRVEVQLPTEATPRGTGRRRTTGMPSFL